MENIIKLIRDIFSMDFDVIIPVSGSIIAVLVGFLLFAIRYFTFNRNRKRYERQQEKAHEDTAEAKADKREEEIAGEETAEGAEELPDKKPDDEEVNAL